MRKNKRRQKKKRTWIRNCILGNTLPAFRHYSDERISFCFQIYMLKKEPKPEEEESIVMRENSASMELLRAFCWNNVETLTPTCKVDRQVKCSDHPKTCLEAEANVFKSKTWEIFLRQQTSALQEFFFMKSSKLRIFCVAEPSMEKHGDELFIKARWWENFFIFSNLSELSSANVKSGNIFSTKMIYISCYDTRNK